jgi:hypothetical protein
MHETQEVVVPNGSETVTQIQVDEPGLSLDTGGLGLRMGVGSASNGAELPGAVRLVVEAVLGRMR